VTRSEPCNGNGHRRDLGRNGLRPALTLAVQAAQDDPLRLDLPGLIEPRGSSPSPDLLREMALLYHQAELEQAGLLAAAEAVAEARGAFSLPRAAAHKLEELARQTREVPAARERALLFGRLFGLGPAATLDADVAENRDFQRLFASFCLGLLRYAAEHRPGRQPGPLLEASLRRSATDLVLNLWPRANGHAVLEKDRIQRQLRRAVDALSDPAIGAALGSRGLWGTLRRVLGDAAPDLGRILARAESGAPLLTTLAGLLPELAADRSGRPLLPADSPAYAQAARWLDATGLAPTSPLLSYLA